MSNSFPRAGTSSEVTHPEALPSSSSLHAEGWRRGVGGGGRAPCFASRGASSPPARPVSSERGGNATGRPSGARWDFCLLGSFGGAGSRSLSFAAFACCLLCPVLGQLSLSSLHALRGDELRESSEACSR